MEEVDVPMDPSNPVEDVIPSTTDKENSKKEEEEAEEEETTFTGDAMVENIIQEHLQLLKQVTDTQEFKKAFGKVKISYSFFSFIIT